MTEDAIIEAAMLGHIKPHFGEDGLCQCTRRCCSDRESCFCLECSCQPGEHGEGKAPPLPEDLFHDR